MDLVLVGGGPRSVIQASSEILFMMLYHQHFDALNALGAQYNLSTTIIEKQATLACGMAFSSGHDGMTNTPVEADITFPLPLPTSTPPSLQSLLSYHARYEARFAGANAPAYFSHLAARNLPGAVMFKRSLGPASATPAGTLDHSKAYLMRRSVGEEELHSFRRLAFLANHLLPFFRLDVRAATMATGIDLEGTRRATAHLRDVASGRTHALSADVLRLNAGTPLVSPVRDPAIRSATFCNAMNADDLGEFLRDRGLLGDDGLLRAGKRLICGGMNLSALDQLAALGPLMNLFEEDEDSLLGYRVTEFAKQRYQGALTCISRRPGKAAMPRHSSAYQWAQGTPVIGRTEHLHSLFLHGNGEGVFEKWLDIMRHTVARATGTTPNGLNKSRGVSTQEALRRMFEETEWHLKCRRNAGVCEVNGDAVGKKEFLKRSTQTVHGAWRQAAVSMILGFGLEPQAQAVEQMERLAPATWTGRRGYLMHRAQIAAVTAPNFAGARSNAGLMGRVEEVMEHVASSPCEVQSMMHLLFEAGIARYEQAAYSSVKAGPEGQVTLRGEVYDGFIVSRVLSQDGDVTWKSLSQQVETLAGSASDVPRVSAHRRFVGAGGERGVVESNGMVGKGFWRAAAGGGESLLQGFGVDVNNRDSAVYDAPMFAMRRMALAHLQAAGLDAHEVLDEIYEGLKARAEEFEAEVERFRGFYGEAVEMWAYLEAVGMFAGADAEVYADLYDSGVTATGRRGVVRKMEESGDVGMEKAAAEYRRLVGTAAEYAPASREEFYDRFVDMTADDHARAYEVAFEVAKSHLEVRGREETVSVGAA